eukprot:8566604-Pyramimonas_sp.AAC.1
MTYAHTYIARNQRGAAARPWDDRSDVLCSGVPSQRRAAARPCDDRSDVLYAGVPSQRRATVRPCGGSHAKPAGGIGGGRRG